MAAAQSHSTRSRSRLFRVVALTFSFVFLFFLFELAIRIFAAAGLLTIPGPPPRAPAIWDPDHESFGVWHTPDATQVLQTRDFSVTYQTNSVGARDVERERESSTSRVVFLGDSVVEGWGVEVEKRLSNLLESKTGVPHLNFGMAHFGPYQSYLAYRDLAKTFAHDTVFLGIFPHNDFLDLDFEAAAHALGYEYRYRPYLVGEYPNYQHVDHRESWWQQFARRTFYTYSAIDFIVSKLARHTIDGYKTPRYNEQGLPYSLLYDFSQEQLQLLTHTVALLQEELEGRELVIILFPALPAFARLELSGPSPLADTLRAAGKEGTLRVIDLLPAMAKPGVDYSKYFVAPEHFDFHLSRRGNVLVGRILRRELADIYP